MDTIGPIAGGAFVVQYDEMDFEPGEGVVAVIASRRLEDSNRVESLVDIGGFKLGECIDLTDTVRDGMAYWGRSGRNMADLCDGSPLCSRKDAAQIFPQSFVAGSRQKTHRYDL